jgi:hypothetical protein
MADGLFSAAGNLLCLWHHIPVQWTVDFIHFNQLSCWFFSPHETGARGSVVDEAVCLKPEGHGLKTQ